MPKKIKENLENQQRFFGTCIFFDEDNDRCGIYSARPDVCKAFGQYKNLACPFSSESKSEKNWYSEEEIIGVLSIDFLWKDFK